MSARAEGVRVADVMWSDVACVEPDDPLDVVLGRMLAQAGHCVPVLVEGRPVGVVTKADLLRPRGERAADVMSSFLLTLRPEAEASLAMALMAYEGVSHLLVVSEGGALVGVVTAQDLLAAMARARGYVIPDHRGRSLENGKDLHGTR